MYTCADGITTELVEYNLRWKVNMHITSTSVKVKTALSESVKSDD